jgi:hypothetical protein
MKKIILFLVVLPVWVFGITFEKKYGTDNAEYGYGVCQTPDGGYIAAGIAETGEDSVDVYIVRTDSVGDTLWTRTYGKPEAIEIILDIFQASEDEYVTVGYAIDSLSIDIYLLKINLSGDTLWTRRYKGPLIVTFGFDGVLGPDGNYVIVGSVASSHSPSCSSSLYILRIDSSGDVLDTRQYGEGSEGGLSVNLVPDGGYIFTGWRKRGKKERLKEFNQRVWWPRKTMSNDDIYLVRTDESLDTLWTRTYGKDKEEEGHGVIPTEDNGFLITGFTESFSPDFTSDIYVIKTDSMGDTMWTQIYGGDKSDGAGRGFMASDGNYVIPGYTESFDAKAQPNSHNSYIIKIDRFGNLLWERVYGDNTSEDWVFSGQETLDKGFIFVGSREGDLYLIKTDSTGRVGIEEENKERLDLFQLSPNPSYGWIDIKYSVEKAKVIEIEIYDIVGRKVDCILNRHSVPGIYTVRYKTVNLLPGIYFVTFRTYKQKIVILK